MHVVVGQQPAAVRRQRLGHLLEHLDPRRLRPADPAVQERGRELLAGLLPELPQVLLHVVGRRQRLVQRQRLLQPSASRPSWRRGSRRFFSSSQRVPLSTFFCITSVASRYKRPTQVGELLVEELDHMEAVEDDLRLGQVVGTASLVGRRHVHGHRLDLGPAGPQPLPERLQRVGPLAVADEDHRAALQVHDHRQVAVPLGHGDLVDGDAAAGA